MVFKYSNNLISSVLNLPATTKIRKTFKSRGWEINCKMTVVREKERCIYATEKKRPWYQDSCKWGKITKRKIYKKKKFFLMCMMKRFNWYLKSMRELKKSQMSKRQSFKFKKLKTMKKRKKRERHWSVFNKFPYQKLKLIQEHYWSRNLVPLSPLPSLLKNLSLPFIVFRNGNICITDTNRKIYNISKKQRLRWVNSKLKFLTQTGKCLQRKRKRVLLYGRGQLLKVSMQWKLKELLTILPNCYFLCLVMKGIRNCMMKAMMRDIWSKNLLINHTFLGSKSKK